MHIYGKEWILKGKLVRLNCIENGNKEKSYV